MLRVRPGVELVFATFAPSRELMTLDFPTFDLPRNATSGYAGAGNRLASVADITNLDKTRIKIRPLGINETTERQPLCIRPPLMVLSPRGSVQPEGTFVLDVLFCNGYVFAPEIKDGGNHNADANTDQKKPPVGGERDKKKRDHCDRNHKPRGTTYGKSHPSRWNFLFSTCVF
jgi:hypothetical protein